MCKTTEPKRTEPQPIDACGLVDGKRLLEILWPLEQCRPSWRWLQQYSGKTIPCIRIGHLVYFDPVEVRRSLLARSSSTTEGGTPT
ncbi:MAG TPA: hypothetical protein PKI20_06705 [Verrucomicrobiota bacterium]|nr:hypothetical protein [Verrucomicrobiota bacterium]